MKKLMYLMIGMILYFQFVHTGFTSSSNERYNWGFAKGHGGKPAEAGKNLDDMLKRHGAIYKGNITKKDIYLTFDNGYENGYTSKILDVLKKEKVPAAFFVTGHYLQSASDLTKRMVKEGHIVGNHSWHHPDLTTKSEAEIVKELDSVKLETEKLTGQKGMVYLRPPRGVFSERTMEIANAHGYKHIFWSLAFVDWKVDSQKGPMYSYNHVMRQIHPGAIILLHTVSKDNADALDKIIIDLKKQGYTFKSLDALMMGKDLKDPMLY